MAELSIYQKAIKEAYTQTKDNLVVEACPGSGKTFTLLLLAKETPLLKKSIFLAFNKSIAEELKRKLPSHISSMTLHSLGMRSLLRHYGSLKVNENKTFILARKNLDLSRLKEDKEILSRINELCKLYDLYRMNLVEDIEQLNDLAFQFDCSFSEEIKQDFVNLLSVMDDYNRKIKKGYMIDFTDMLYLCTKLRNDSFDKYDIVFIDECQDLNPLQKTMVELIKKPTSRQISVGDSKQCIYTFAGASLNSFEYFKQQSHTTTLPLSVTYRCAKSITEEANKVFPGMESFSSNEEGSVSRGSYKDIKEGDFVLCRNNKPLVKLYIKLLAEGKKATIYGKEYGESLLRLLKNTDAKSYQDLIDHLQVKKNEIISELKEKGVAPGAINNHPRLVAFTEMSDILLILLEETQHLSIEKIKEMIQGMFSSSLNKGVTLMSCHKSKGLENDRVFILDIELIPSIHANSQQMLYSEYCLKYVAITRAKKELIYISSKEFDY